MAQRVAAASGDLLSYPIPDAFVREHVDSRLCPKQVNVTIKIARVTSVLGFGEFANPPVVEERCTWLEVAEDCASPLP